MNEDFAFLLPVVMGLFGAAFLIVARFGIRSSAYWGAGILSAALGFVVPLSIPALPVKPVAMTAEALFFAAFFLYGQALLVHFGRSTLFWQRLSLALLAYVVIAYVVIVAENLQLELFVSDLTCVILLAIAVAAVRHRARRPIDKLLFWVMVFVCAENLLRVIVFLFLASPITMDQFAGSDYSFVMQITATVGAMVMAMTALAVMTVNVVERHRNDADSDSLTGLLNRRGFDRAVAGLLAGEAQDVALILLDIDHFKRINDDYGHAVGDEVIRSIAEVTAAVLPGGSILARFGGEEFVALLPNHTAARALDVAGRMQAAIRKKNWRNLGLEGGVTASFGIDALGRGDHSIYESIGRADGAMYEAKRTGRDRIVSAGGTTSPAAHPHLRIIRKQ